MLALKPIHVDGRYVGSHWCWTGCWSCRAHQCNKLLHDALSINPTLLLKLIIKRVTTKPTFTQPLCSFTQSTKSRLALVPKGILEYLTDGPNPSPSPSPSPNPSPKLSPSPSPKLSPNPSPSPAQPQPQPSPSPNLSHSPNPAPTSATAPTQPQPQPSSAPAPAPAPAAAHLNWDELSSLEVG